MNIRRERASAVWCGGLVSPSLATGTSPGGKYAAMPRGSWVGRTLMVFAVLVGMVGCGSGGSGSGGGAPSPHYVSLTWQASTSAVIGYYVYRGSTADTLSKLTGMIDNATNYTDNSVSDGQTYVYAVTAVDSENVESELSTPVTVTIPTD